MEELSWISIDPLPLFSAYGGEALLFEALGQDQRSTRHTLLLLEFANAHSF
jgi:hypothetical protein